MGDEDAQTRRAIGEASRAARRALHLTQAQVADALGLAPEVYGRTERGLMTPSVPSLLSIEWVFRIAPDQLLGWTDAHERILAQLERADAQALERADSVLAALLAPERKK